MSPLKTVAAGVVLLLVAAAGLIYVAARPRPLVQALQPEALPATEVQSDDEPATAEASLEFSPALPPRQLPLPSSTEPRIKTFAVKLHSPVMAETFVAPATVKLKASANHSSELERVEYYSGPFLLSVCQSLTNPEPIFGSPIGEALSSPYEFSWTNDEAGVYNIIAVAHYKTGEQQLSDPTVIVVNKKADYHGPEWIGWRPPYLLDITPHQDLTLMPSPTPPPSLSECPTITVKSLGLPPGLKGPMTFKAELSGSLPKDVAYAWTISAGEIVAGKDTSTITVDVNTVLDKYLVAGVEVRRLNAICPNTASTAISFVQPRWMNERMRPVLLESRWNLQEIEKTQNRRDAQVYILAASDSHTCVDSEILKEARFLKRYLIEVGKFKSEQIHIRNDRNIASDGLSVEVLIKFPGESAPDGLNDSMMSSAGRGIVPCQPRLMTKVSHASSPPINRTCPDVEDRIFYATNLSAIDAINTCPFNPKDPQNSQTQIALTPRLTEGTYGQRPTFRYWANGGQIISEGPIGIWDLSDVKLRPGVFTAISRSDDGCDCPSTNARSVTVTNFCTPCLTLQSSCDPDEPNKRQHFSAKVGTFALAGVATYDWVTSKGKIVSGQGTGKITVDTSELTEDESFDVTVRAGGLLRYCVNQLSIKAIVGNCPAKTAVFDEFGQIPLPSRRARRRPPEVETPPIVGAGTPETGSTSTTTPPVNVDPKVNEKEWMSVSWSPRVKTDENFSVTVTYNRTTEAIELTSSPGDISEELKLGSRFKSLRERYGPEYEVFANARLIAAGIECSSCAQEQYQSLDSEKVEWSWPVSPGGKGTQVFNVELWIRAEPRDKQSGRQSIAAEKVWSRNNLKVEVAETILTRNNVLAGGSLCAVLGLGLCVRGLKIYRVGDTYNVGQAVAVGRNVTMNNTTVNQEATKQNAQSGENKDA